MVVTETYGGKCPICSYDRMLMRYGSTGWYQYDACPRCGFAYGTQPWDEKGDTPKQIWENIIDADRKHLKNKGFPLTIEGLRMWMESLLPPDENRDTVFAYDEKFLRPFKERYERYGFSIKGVPILKEKVVFT